MPSKQTFKKGKPAWLKKQLPKGRNYQRVKGLLSNAGLHTVCQEASCPNRFECFSKETSAFMILGTDCTRNCPFCNVTPGKPGPIDPDEPMRIAETALALNLKYIVVTSVTRDDLEDGGASCFAQTIHAIKSTFLNDPKVEVLIPDFKGDINALKTVLDAKPDVLNHNIETVPSLYPKVRPEAMYERSLALISNVKKLDPSMQVKSGILIGLGETRGELFTAITDLFNHGCDILTLGQYLQPTKSHLKVKQYYTPEEFEKLEKLAKNTGFTKVAAGPFVRSSYQAMELYEN